VVVSTASLGNPVCDGGGIRARSGSIMPIDLTEARARELAERLAPR
jgi:hypothetical protein